MRPIRILAGSAVLLAATASVIAGHDFLTRESFAVLADGGYRGATRTASPIAALLVHLIAGFFVLPLLSRMKVVLAMPDAGIIAVATAIAAVTLRAVTEAATGLLIEGLPVFTMAVLATGIAVASSLRRGVRSRLRVAAPRLVGDLRRRSADAA